MYKILAFYFNELKKFKINTLKELKNAISQIKFEKYDFFQIYVNNDYFKNKYKEQDRSELTLSRGNVNQQHSLVVVHLLKFYMMKMMN